MTEEEYLDQIAALRDRCLECLRRTVQLDPWHADAYEQTGYFLGAEDAFRKATERDAGADSYIGLAGNTGGTHLVRKSQK